MATDLHDILPSVTVGGAKISCQHLVYFPGKIVDFTKDNPPRDELCRRESAAKDQRENG
jgi:hypothetical protein